MRALLNWFNEPIVKIKKPEEKYPETIRIWRLDPNCDLTPHEAAEIAMIRAHYQVMWWDTSPPMGAFFADAQYHLLDDRLKSKFKSEDFPLREAATRYKRELYYGVRET